MARTWHRLAGESGIPAAPCRASWVNISCTCARGVLTVHPDRLPATFHRTHGVRCFHGCCSLADDTLWSVTCLREGADHTLAALKTIRAARPDGASIHVILDNLWANKIPVIRTWAKRHKVELCLTPTSAFWANPIEPQFGPLRTFVIGNSHHRHRDVMAVQRRERARVRGQKGVRFGGRPLTIAA